MPTTPEQLESMVVEAARRGSTRRTASAADAAAFRAVVEARLKALEAELAEVKSRLNGLLFLAAGAVLTQVVLHLFRW